MSVRLLPRSLPRFKPLALRGVRRQSVAERGPCRSVVRRLSVNSPCVRGSCSREPRRLRVLIAVVITATSRTSRDAARSPPPARLSPSPPHPSSSSSSDLFIVSSVFLQRGGARDAVVVETHRGIREALDAACPRPRSRTAAAAPAPLAFPPHPAPLDFVQEHSRPRHTNGHGPPQIPSPPSVSNTAAGGGGGGGGSSVPRAGTREVHNKLEKNRRAHLKECFELLKRQLPAAGDDKKTSNLSILGSAIRYIQVLRRKERECEHEMERLAREKIAAQQRLAALRRDAAVRGRRLAAPDEELVNGQLLGMPLNVSPLVLLMRTSTGGDHWRMHGDPHPKSSHPRIRMFQAAPPPPPAAPASSRAESPLRSLNLSTKLRPLPIQITPTTSAQVSVEEPGVTSTLNSLVRPAQIHLPLSQVVAGGGLVVGPALQLLPAGLRVLHNGNDHSTLHIILSLSTPGQPVSSHNI
ncbi:max binding protein mnt [Danaus plexippus plexippus]|uniref:Max-binding protein MNT n=1 Tax=Danaus plexippus plexippus TaxID=278856 RepID=A0A212FM59_DANPL|nr:max binding protein mnt [Danaus plexippus plexippus]